MNSQYERTRLAWRRTILTLTVVGALGAVHLAIAGWLVEASIVVVMAGLGGLAAIRRLRSLRREQERATWQPAVLTLAACLMALAAFVPA